ncbi:hypothetical protein L218DRAFT_965943 [Marasmius fiardii PR-910]|nr:hypothetical protein L218DRAFT_965943 [Marasmius fiardii PR-910]
MTKESEKVRMEMRQQCEEMRLISKYEEIIRAPVYKHEETDKHNLLCVASNCYSNCLLDCTLEFTLDSEVLAELSIFSGSSGQGLKRRCKLCGHLAQDHRHYRSKWVKEIELRKVIDKEAKERYERAKMEESKLVSVLRVIEENIARLEKDRINHESVVQGIEEEIARLEEDIVDLEVELADLCDGYNDLRLSGRLSIDIQASLCLLLLRESKIKENGATLDALQRMAKRIERVEEKLTIVLRVESRGK